MAAGVAEARRKKQAAAAVNSCLVCVFYSRSGLSMYLCACEWCVWGGGSVRESDRVCICFCKFQVCMAVREKVRVCSFVCVHIRVDR